MHHVSLLKSGPHMDALQKAIDILGGQARLADAIGVTQPAIANMIKRRSVPPIRATQIEIATKGKVKRVQLCPEVFGK